jgi:hypothetical protein
MNKRIQKLHKIALNVYTDTSNSLLINVHLNKPVLLTKNSINNPSTEISAKFYISTPKTLVTAINTTLRKTRLAARFVLAQT